MKKRTKILLYVIGTIGVIVGFGAMIAGSSDEVLLLVPGMCTFICGKLIDIIESGK